MKRQQRGSLHGCYAPCQSLAASEFSEFPLRDYSGPVRFRSDPTLVRSESISDHSGTSGDVSGTSFIISITYPCHLILLTDIATLCMSSIVPYLLRIGPMTLM